jgi:hypothetical protein
MTALILNTLKSGVPFAKNQCCASALVSMRIRISIFSNAYQGPAFYALPIRIQGIDDQKLNFYWRKKIREASSPQKKTYATSNNTYIYKFSCGSGSTTMLKILRNLLLHRIPADH